MKTIIQSKLPNTLLPEKWGLVLEGAGTRGNYIDNININQSNTKGVEL